MVQASELSRNALAGKLSDDYPLWRLARPFLEELKASGCRDWSDPIPCGGSNGGDGVHTTATATSTTLKSIGSGSSGENGGAEFRLGVAAINGGGNKADGVSIPKTNAPQKCCGSPRW